MINFVLTSRGSEIEITKYDFDDEILVEVTSDETVGIYLNADQARKIIDHLQQALQTIIQNHEE